MKSLMLMISLLFSFTALAAPVCDFPYDLAEEEGVKELSWVGIDASTRLTALQQKQVIETAKRMSDERVPARPTLKWAINSLSSNSEGGDITMMIFRFRGSVYTIIQSYPGGNPVGVVYKGLEAVALRSDGDLSCEGL
jgi:hypothetical protein